MKKLIITSLATLIVGSCYAGTKIKCEGFTGLNDKKPSSSADLIVKFELGKTKKNFIGHVNKAITTNSNVDYNFYVSEHKNGEVTLGYSLEPGPSKFTEIKLPIFVFERLKSDESLRYRNNNPNYDVFCSKDI